MLDIFKKECKLCETIIKDEHFKIIDDITRGIFCVLLLKLTLDNEIQNVMCMKCFSKLLAALNFKSMCLCTDNGVIPVNLKEVYTKEKTKEIRDRLFDNHEICRLCLQIVSSDFTSIQEVPIDTVQIYIPEINIAVSAKPVICIKCHDALCVYSSFIRNCLEVERKRSMVAIDVGETLLTSSCIKTEEIEIKPELVDDATLSEILCNPEKRENEEGAISHSQNDLVDMKETKSLYHHDDLRPTAAESTFANYKSTSESLSAGHELEHKKVTDAQVNRNDGSVRKRKRQYVSKNQVKSMTKQVHQCDKCAFKTRFKNSFKRHQLRHKYISEVQTYACSKCKFITKHKLSLIEHQSTHKSPSQVPVHERGKSTHNEHLKQVQFVHNNTSEMQLDAYEETELKHKYVYQCEKCDYKSRKKANFRRHELVHKNSSEVQLYRCDKCKFVTKHNESLTQHRLTHKGLSELPVYVCEECKFVTKHKKYLKEHKLKHKDPSEVPMYECGICAFRTKYKKSLKQHQSQHPARMF